MHKNADKHTTCLYAILFSEAYFSSLKKASIRGKVPTPGVKETSRFIKSLLTTGYGRDALIAVLLIPTIGFDPLRKLIAG